MSDKACVKIVENDLNFESEVSAKLAHRLIQLVLAERTGEPLEKISSSDQSVPTQRVSLRAYVRESQAQRNPDKIVAVGVYWLKYLDQTEFTRDQIIQGLQQAGVEVPKNLSRDLKWAEKNNWLASSTEKNNTYYVTNEGVRVVEEKFPEKLLSKTSVRKRG